MTTYIPPRLRAPMRIIVVGAIIVAVAVATQGWAPPVYLVLIPFILLVAFGYYAWGGRDSDLAAVVRQESDERQAYYRLKVQALVGKVLGLAVAVVYLVTFYAKATLWPLAILLGLSVLTTLAGWVIYRDHSQHGDDQTHGQHN